MNEPSAAQIAAAFDAEFAISHCTVMRGGGVEPLYLPATAAAPAQVLYTQDYPASALHEAAHWCLAGARRRRLRDYGYWYVPGRRSAAQRRAFFMAERQVQALESLFAAAAGVKFVVSADDFEAPAEMLERFAAEVGQHAAALQRAGLPPRASRFCARLTWLENLRD